MPSSLLTAGLLLAGMVAAPQEPTPEEIIERFADRESEFAAVWEQYTYRQTFIIEVLDDFEQARERMTIEMEVYFTSDGERKMRRLSDRGGLASVSLTDEDIYDAVHIQPFALTRENLADYEIDFQGTETVDELETYVFRVRPRRIERGKRYFRGSIWVDRQDLQIVRTIGKAVPETRDNKFPRFETIRQMVDGKYWFPVWTHADDRLTFGSSIFADTVHIRQWILYREFQKFEVGTAVKFGGEEQKPPGR